MQAAIKKATKADSSDQTRAATALLQADDKLVGELFAVYDKAQSSSRKKTFVARIRTELTVPAQAEDEVFYPALSAGPGAR